MSQSDYFASCSHCSRIVAVCRPKDSGGMSICSTDGEFILCSQCFVIIARWTWQCRNCGNSCTVCDACARQPSPCCGRHGEDLEFVELAFACSSCSSLDECCDEQLEQDASSINAGAQPYVSPWQEEFAMCSRCLIIIARWNWPCCSCTSCCILCNACARLACPSCGTFCGDGDLVELGPEDESIFLQLHCKNSIQPIVLQSAKSPLFLDVLTENEAGDAW